MKMKTIKLSYPHINQNGTKEKPNYLYRVEIITDSVDYTPHSFLTRAEVSDLTNFREWKVTIVPSSLA